jgi:DNA-binding IclR family transcriptional regulator
MTIQSIARAADILALFSSSHTYLGIAEIAGALKLNKGTVWGLVTTLEQRGFLQQDPATRKYTVGPRLFELGMVYVGSLEINSKASRPAHRLASRTGLTARVGIWDSGSVLITLAAMPRSKDSLSHQFGPRVPAYCSGIGKALLAYLDRDELRRYLKHAKLVRHTPATIISTEKLLADLEKTRERGYSIAREEMIPGSAALGAPVFGRKQELVGAISIAESPRLMFGPRMEEFAQELVSTAAEISSEMGYFVTAEDMKTAFRNFYA